MKRKYVITICAIGIICLGIIAFIMAVFVTYKGELLETWQTENTPFTIRIDKYAERGGFVPGAYYVFSSIDNSDNNSNTWREIMTFRHDDPVDIPRESVRFTNDQIASISMSWMYAVTTDGGKSWRVLRMWDFLNDGEKCIYECIDELHIRRDGTGEIRLNLIADPHDKIKIMRTNDFGMTWVE